MHSLIRATMKSGTLAGLVISGLFPLYGQQVVIDWPSKTLISFPQIVDRSISVNVVVNDANDLLYQYKIKLVAVPQCWTTRIYPRTRRREIRCGRSSPRPGLRDGRD